MLLAQLWIAQHFGWPVPSIQDEFSYLLAGETFAMGRATNPNHPAWEFLETYHVLQPVVLIFSRFTPPVPGGIWVWGSVSASLEREFAKFWCERLLKGDLPCDAFGEGGFRS